MIKYKGDDILKESAEAIVKMTPGRAALVALMERYLRGLLDPFITLLEVHKLMYFLQEAGENLRLDYREAHYGPYAENLRHVFKRIEGHYVTGYADGGDAPQKPLELVEGVASEAARVLRQYPETQARLDRVFTLVEGFESSFGLELLASVHWKMVREHPRTLQELSRKIYAWNAQKRKFSERQIALAARTLHEQGWLEGAMPLLDAS